jgi:hypothetical protein
MALTQSAWTVTSANGRLIAKCTVTATTAENDAYTLKTPIELDTTKPWSLSLECSATPDGAALPLDLWIGWSDLFALSGDGANVVSTVNSVRTGAKYKQIFDDVVLAVTTLNYVFHFDPELAVADVVTVAAIASGPKVKIPVAPYYAFNLNGGSTLNAHTATWTIIQ